jgi:hypothetical protein
MSVDEILGRLDVIKASAMIDGAVSTHKRVLDLISDIRQDHFKRKMVSAPKANMKRQLKKFMKKW